MNQVAFEEFVYSQLDRGQIRDILMELTGNRPRLRKPEAASELASRVFSCTPKQRKGAWELVLAEALDWRQACDDFGLPESKKALRQYLVGSWKEGAEQSSQPTRSAESRRSATTEPMGLPGKNALFVGARGHVKALKHLIEEATEEVVIAAFVLSGGFAHLQGPLEAAAERGVKVKLLLDGRMTGRGKGKQNKKIAKDLLGINVQYGRIHAKAAVIDSRYVLVGSSNMENPEYELRVYQANILLDNEELAASLLSSFEEILEPND